MNAFVLDCSVSMGWCFPEEGTQSSLASLHLLKETEALVPSLWSLETANCLLMAQKRGKIKAAEVSRFISLLKSLPIRMDPDTHERALEEIFALAHEHGLTSYDASYLELAMRNGVPLATFDQELRRAAKRAGVPLLKP